MIQKKNNSFVTGALIIAVSNLLVKFIGALYKIPLDRMILKTEGMGIYNSAYIIYNLLFVISTAGIPVAISKMVAETQALGQFSESKKILRVSKTLLFIIGLISFAAMFLFARPLANRISAPSAYLTMFVMSPSLLFVAMASSYRGFYQGQQNMLPTAISEIIEAFSKLVFGISFALLFKNIVTNANSMYKFMSIIAPHAISDLSPDSSINELVLRCISSIKFVSETVPEKSAELISLFQSAVPAAGAIAGVTTGTLLSLCYLTVYNKTKKLQTEVYISKTSSTKAILRKLVKIAVPITLGVCVFSLTSVIDMMTVMNLLEGLGYSQPERLSMYGYLGRATTMFGFPPTIIQAVAISVVPAIAAALIIKNKNEALSTAKSAIRITILLALPCAIILSGLAEGILKLLYQDGNYSILLTFMGIAVLFVTLVQVCGAILQAWGKAWLPVINMAIGGLVKIVVNLTLVSQPEINIQGAPIGTIFCYLTVMSLNLWQLKRVSGIKFEIMDFIIKPAFTAAITIFAAIFSFKFLDSVFPVILSVAGSIAITGAVYIISVFSVKALKKEDVMLLPKGDKIVGILDKFKILG